MSNQAPSKIVDDRSPEYLRYQSRMAIVEASDGEASEAIAAYWWNLYLIYRDDDWRAEFEHLRDWLGDFTAKPFGKSRQTFFNVMRAISRWKSLGLADNQVRQLLGKRKVALEGDIEKWFDGEKMIPEVEAALNNKGEKPKEVLLRAADLGDGEARKEILSFVERDHIYTVPDVYSLGDDGLLFNLRWENEKKGLIGEWTIQVTAKQISPEKGNGLPDTIGRYLASRLGIRL